MRFLKKNKKITIIISVFLVLAILISVCMIYLMDYYKADMAAIEAFLPQDATYYERDGMLIFGEEDAQKGLIFYPGGKVEYTAYIPLMSVLAEKGFLCVLVQMPFHLAVFDSDAADGIQDEYLSVSDWYIGGHSLGGAMAASYIADCAEEYRGLFLLGAYSTADLSVSSLSVLSVYGSEDLVMDKEKYEENKKNLPEDYREYIIDGGCHAYFGMYGTQEGDGIPTISCEEQIALTADAIAECFK